MARFEVYNFQKCLNFNGSSTKVILVASKILAGQTNCTFLGWIRTTRVPPNSSTIPAIYCERASSGNDIFKLEINTTGRLRLTYRDDAGTLNQPTNNSGKPVNNGTWHQVGFIKSGTSITIIVDGAIDHTATLTANDTMTNSPFSAEIGHDVADSASWFFDDIDEVRLYTRALTMVEVNELYAYRGTANSLTNLVGWYKLDDNATDSSGTRAAGTVSNGAFSSDVVYTTRTSVG